MNRRQFITSAAMAGAGLIILPHALNGADAASKKLNMALIGTWGRGAAHFGTLAKENVVALCDVNEQHLADAAKRFPGAKTYVDWRKCLDQKDIEAVMIATTDHTHAFATNWAINRGMHVYCEKPIGITVEEARVVRANYLKNKSKIATQVGTQRHELENFNRVRELIRDGAIGQLTDAYAWGDRKIPRPGYLPAQGSPPTYLHYDLWLGPAQEHPYNPGYFAGGPGANCLCWNMFWDFGTGQVGDMGSHTMDLVWNAIDATLPTSAEGSGDAFNPDVTPVKLETHFTFPANSWRPEMRVSWYQGGAMPSSPSKYVDLNKVGHGAMFKGTQGFIVCDFSTRLVIPYGKQADMTYYHPRAKEAVAPPMGNFQAEWVNACKGDLKTSCNFEYACNMVEMMNLGLVAYRVGKKLQYDGAAGQVTNIPEANQYLAHKVREGWTING